MKCPSCPRNHKRSAGFRCACGYVFALDPKTMRRWTDRKFLSIIRKASAGDTSHFTAEQLYAAYCYKLSLRGPLYWLAVSLVLTLIFALLAFGISVSPPSDGKTFVTGLLIAVGIFLAASSLKFISTFFNRSFLGPPSRKFFEHLLSQWQQAKGPIPRMLTTPELHDPPPAWAESDIFDYGVERILVVQRPILVDLLVKNGFHARERMLVVAANEYPDYIAAHVRRFVAEQPDLPVFLLHDATREGTDLINTPFVRELTENSASSPIDLGLFPADTKKLKALRPLRPRRRRGELPVDSLMTASLGGLVTACLVAGIPVGEGLRQREHGSDVGDGSDTFGYG